jgi:hypothetical protein
MENNQPAFIQTVTGLGEGLLRDRSWLIMEHITALQALGEPLHCQSACGNRIDNSNSG